MSIEEKAVEETAKTLRQYIDPMLLAPLSELGLLTKDKIAFWRFRNQVEMLKRTKEIIDNSGFDTKTINASITPDLAVPLIESSGDSSDQNIREMFARLLANAIKSPDGEIVHPSYAKALNQLAPLDAFLLNLLFQVVKRYEAAQKEGQELRNIRGEFPIYRQIMLNLESATTKTGKSNEVVTISFQNIRRLGLCDQGKEVLNFLNRNEILVFTDYGYSLASQCIDNQ